MSKLRVTAVLILVMVSLGACTKHSPKRDQIPFIKSNLFKLQEGVKAKNLAAIDSLLSPKILEKNQSSDSLVRLVYGPDDSYSFTQFGGAEIIYATNDGRIDCYIMDSTQQRNRPLVFYLTHDDNLWLITGFRTGEDTLTNK